MARDTIVTGLDVGTYSIKALVAQKRGNGWEVLSYAEVPSFGLRKGMVVNGEEASRNIQKLVADVTRETGKRLSSVFVNINGNHLYVTPSDGIISVSRADQLISKEDVERVLQATKAINRPQNEEVLDVFPREFVIDDQRGIKHPEGLTGVRLEAKVLLLCYFQQYFMNLTQALFNAKLQINDVIPSPLAAAQAVLTPQQKELGVALIDMGATTTSLAVFEDGELIHFAVFPLGSANITNDIAIGLKTEVQVAESIKKQYGTCILGKTEKEKKELSTKKIEMFDGSSQLSFTKKQLVGIIGPRVSEILDLIQKELKKIGRQELLPAGVVLTGGGAKLGKIREFTKDTLKLNCLMGHPTGIVGAEDDPALATVMGLALEGIDFGGGTGTIGLGDMGWLKRFIKNFIP